MSEADSKKLFEIMITLTTRKFEKTKFDINDDLFLDTENMVVYSKKSP